MERAQVVVIGGGVVGASVAYHLAARGVRDVVVLDRAAHAGAGSTGRATGGFRVTFSTAHNVRLSLLARSELLRFADATGGDAGYVPCGYLWIAHDEAELATLREALTVQRACGVDDVVETDGDGIAALNPFVRRDEIAGATFCPRDGFIRPLAILDGYRRAAHRLGVRFAWNAAVTGLRRGRDGRITHVLYDGHTVATDAVVNAAGAWASSVAAFAGVDLPVAPLRRSVAVTVPTDVLPASMPMTIFVRDGFHLRVRDGRVLLLMPGDSAHGDPDAPVDPRWIASVARIACERVPSLAHVAIDEAACWSGLYEMSPDGDAILGAAPGVDNLYLANGSSGHGVMHAPALGLLLAETIVDGAARSLDVTPLRPDRFVPGATGAAARAL